MITMFKVVSVEVRADLNDVESSCGQMRNSADHARVQAIRACSANTWWPLHWQRGDRSAGVSSLGLLGTPLNRNCPVSHP